MHYAYLGVNINENIFFGINELMLPEVEIQGKQEWHLEWFLEFLHHQY